MKNKIHHVFFYLYIDMEVILVYCISVINTVIQWR